MQHSIILSYQTAAGSLVGNQDITGDTELNSDVVLTASSTNIELDIAFTRAKVLALGLMCTAAATVKTNSSGAPQETITLTADIPKVCASNADALVMFAGDVTKLYLTCSAGGTFSIRILLDETPA